MRNYLFKILNSKNSQYRVQFLYNAEPMVWSENYTTKASAQNCIASVKTNASAPIIDTTIGQSATGARFEIVKSTNDQYFVRLKAQNGETLVWSETYTQKHNAMNCAQSVKDHAGSAPAVDETQSALV